MSRIAHVAAVVAIGFACGPVHADPAAVAAGKAAAGPCAGCHGADGAGQPGAGFPRLAGLDAGYLAAQLAAFAAGTRQNAVMAGVVKTLDATARADVVAYYASLPPPQPASSPPSSESTAPGAGLAERGDWGAGIPPCASCHGPDGRGVGAAFPAIAGQGASYIAAQLKAWKSGTRHDDPQGLMRTVAAKMTDAQIAAVSAYYATLPAAGTARRKTPQGEPR